MPALMFKGSSRYRRAIPTRVRAFGCEYRTSDAHLSRGRHQESPRDRSQFRRRHNRVHPGGAMIGSYRRGPEPRCAFFACFARPQAGRNRRRTQFPLDRALVAANHRPTDTGSVVAVASKLRRRFDAASRCLAQPRSVANGLFAVPPSAERHGGRCLQRPVSGFQRLCRGCSGCDARRGNPPATDTPRRNRATQSVAEGAFPRRAWERETLSHPTARNRGQCCRRSLAERQDQHQEADQHGHCGEDRPGQPQLPCLAILLLPLDRLAAPVLQAVLMAQLKGQKGTFYFFGSFTCIRCLSSQIK